MSKISQQTIDAVLQPIGSAKGLPNAAYVDDQAFLHDRDAVLSASWRARYRRRSRARIDGRYRAFSAAVLRRAMCGFD